MRAGARAAARWLGVAAATPALALGALHVAGARPWVTVLSGTTDGAHAMAGAAYVAAWLLCLLVTPGALAGAAVLLALSAARRRRRATGS